MEEKWELSPYQKNIRNLCMAYEGTAIEKNGGYFYTETMTDYRLWQQVQRDILKIYPVLRLVQSAEGSLFLKNYETYHLPVENLDTLSLEEARPVMESWMRTCVETEEKPLFDWRFVQLKQGICMYGAFHHIIMDSASIAVMLKKQEELYQQREKGETPALQEEWDYLKELQEKRWPTKENARAINWYKRLWAGEKHPKAFLPHRPDGQAEQVRMEIPKDLETLIRTAKREHHISVESMVYAAVFILLSHLSGADEVAIGRVAGNRKASQFSRLGMYVNIQPVLVVLKEDMEFGTLAKQLKMDLFEQLRIADYPYMFWKEAVGGNEEIFDCTISYRNLKFLPRMEQAKVGELFNGVLETPLRLIFDEDTCGMSVELQFAVKEWQRAEGERFLQWFFEVLRLGLKDQTVKVRQLIPWKAECEKGRHQGEPWKERRGFTRSCLEHLKSQREEIVLKDRDRQMTGKQILDFCSLLLEERDFQRHGLVGIRARRSVLLPAAILAVLFSGNGFLLIPTEDEKERQSRLESYCSMVLTEKELNSCFEIIENGSGFCGDWEKLEAAANLECETDTAYAISTSGTTGHPKLAMVSAGALSCRLAWMEHLLLEEGEKIKKYTCFQKTRLTFDVAIWELLLPFYSGGCAYLLEHGREADFEEIGNIMKQEQIQVVHFVPSALEGFLRYIRKRKWEFPKLKHVILSGEALTAPLAREAGRLFQNADIWNFYGPAECTIDVSCYQCTGQESSIPIGTPAWETGLSVVNSRGEEVPDGIEGELVITGKLVGKGYLEGTAEKEQQNRFFYRDGKRAYRTGDYAVWRKNGSLYFLGRKDREVKVRGMRLNLAQIESALEKVRGVTGAAVKKENEGLTAYYTAECELYPEVLREELKKELPYYSLPDKFCCLEQFPLGRTGKKDLSGLADMSREAYMDRSEKQNPDIGNVAGKDEDWKDGEKNLRKIFSHYLGQKLKNPTESLFEAGLTSIGAAQAVLDLEEAGYDYSFQDIYRYSNIRALWENRRQKKQLLIPLGEKKKEKTEYAVCFPYAAGGPACFVQMAETLEDSEVQLFAAQPGLFPELSYEEAAEKILDILPENKVLHIVGYCAGYAGALALAAGAKKRGREVKGLWLLGALPYKAGKKGQIIWDYIPEKTAICFLEHLYGGSLAFSPKRYEQFLSEVRKSFCYCRDFREKLEMPAYLLFGTRDPLTFGSAAGYEMFRRILKGPLKGWRLKGEGHYFVEKRGREIGRLFLKYKGGEGNASENSRI